ncbi:Blue-light-activated protein [Enhygromyxa salina]|uniref:histidine kinase n=2 Tax=Enhygromyxa salina TaxID=215803 RepID=A0A2S9YYD1_9BACT|nr:Blue-light-activated protein [Enhygromyxa salina]
MQRLRDERDRLLRENAELRARATLDEQLNSDATRYELIVSKLAEGVVLHGADGQILTCNPAATRILGLSFDQIAGRSSLDPRWQAIREDGTPFSGDTHPAMISLRTGEALSDVIMGVRKPDGSLTWISIHSQPLFHDGHEMPHAVVASFADITAFKQSEARARVSEQKLRFALEVARMGIWQWNAETGRVRWSDAVAGIFGLEPGAFAKTYEAYVSLVHPADRTSFEATVQRTLTSGPANDDFIIEHRVLHPDGTTHWVANFGRVLRNEQGTPVGMAGTVTDISARKSLEDQLVLSQRMQTVGRLAGGVAHDFNNLLTAILGCSELGLLHRDLDPEVRDSLETIREASERAARLTKQLLSFARKQVLELEVFDLEELVRDTQRLLSRIIGEDVEIQMQIGSGPAWIRADRAQIEQVVVNLAVNARDAMPSGGVLGIEVAVRTRDGSTSESLPAGSYALLEVRDTGHGIDATTLAHIFDPFFTTKTEGTGLGLSTCYGIVKQLGGEILVASEVGRGSRFSIYLPLALAPTDRVDAKLAPVAPRSGSGRILLAEDDAVVRATVERGLRAIGYEVLSAASGPAALELLASASGAIDLLISDIVMPNMTGYELAVRVRQQLPKLEVLFVSGYADRSLDRERAHPTIADAIHLPKPYTVSRLAEVIAELLSASRMPFFSPR